MSVEGILSQGRAAALRLMREACTVERKDGPPVLDEPTGQLTQGWVEIYAGPCRGKTATPSESEWGEREVTFARFQVAFPWDTTPAIRRDDRIIFTSSDDAWLVGRQLHVIGVALNGTSTARRVTVEDREG
jgi:hypothetical protein